MIDLEGKRILVTGADDRIASAIRDGLLEANANVFFSDKMHGGSRDTFPSKGGAVSIVKSALDTLGQIDVYVNVFIATQNNHSINNSMTEWRQFIHSKLNANIYLNQIVAKSMYRQRCGKIVNTMPIGARVPRVDKTMECVAGAALLQMTRCLAFELAPHQVTANTVLIGSNTVEDNSVVESILVEGQPDKFLMGVPLGNVTHGEDVANSIAFLASDYSSHITGQYICIDGGETLC